LPGIRERGERKKGLLRARDQAREVEFIKDACVKKTLNNTPGEWRKEGRRGGTPRHSDLTT